MAVFIANAGSNPWAVGGSPFGLVINADGSLNVGSISQNISVTSAANRTTVLSDVYSATSGVTTIFSGNAIPNDFDITFKALTTNTDYIGLGSKATLFAQSGLRLYPGDSVKVALDNTNRLAFVTRVTGEGVEVFSET